MRDYSRLDAIGLGAWQAAEGLQGEDHVGQLLLGVVDILRYLQVPFAAVAPAVVKVVGEPFQFRLVYQIVGGAAESLDVTPILAAEYPLGKAENDLLLLEPFVVAQTFLDLPLSGECSAVLTEPLTVVGALLCLVKEVADPVGDGRDVGLCPLPLEEGKHIEIAVTLGRLRPELAGYLDDRFYPEGVDLNGVEPFRHTAKPLGVVISIEL